MSFVVNHGQDHTHILPLLLEPAGWSRLGLLLRVTKLIAYSVHAHIVDGTKHEGLFSPVAIRGFRKQTLQLTVSLTYLNPAPCNDLTF